MKVLIAYDGSGCSDAALDDLVRAGFPDRGEARVISIAESWSPSAFHAPDRDGTHRNWRSERPSQAEIRFEEKQLAEARTFANHAMRRLEKTLPKWHLNSHAAGGSPAREILDCAAEFDPDLIVVGSHGRSACGRIFLGSISQKVLTEARCSVRIARRGSGTELTPVKIIAGFDGSSGSQAVIDELLLRKWGAPCEVKLVTAVESVTPSTIGRFIPPKAIDLERADGPERQLVEQLAEDVLQRLNGCGLGASLSVRAGNPKQVLVEEAEKWNADCIFVGANGSSSLAERYILGTTSAAIAARSQRSVEAVRKRCDCDA